MHVVLLGLHPEIAEPRDNRIVGLDNVHSVLDDASGVLHPLTADHELVAGVVAEGIAHPAVPSGDADAALDRIQQPRLLLAGDASHRPDRHDKAQGLHLGFVKVNVHRVGDFHLEPLSCNTGAKTSTHCFGSCPSQPPQTINADFILRLHFDITKGYTATLRACLNTIHCETARSLPNLRSQSPIPNTSHFGSSAICCFTAIHGCGSSLVNKQNKYTGSAHSAYVSPGWMSRRTLCKASECSAPDGSFQKTTVTPVDGGARMP